MRDPDSVDPHRSPWFSDAEVADLGAGLPVIRDDFLGEGALACARAARAHLEALTPAMLGRGREHRPDLRGDHTAFLSEIEVEPALGDAWARFEQLRLALNQEVWLGLRRFEVQLAHYPGGGARYVRHFDAFRGDVGRRVTAIVYLNEGWSPEDGGVLRLHLPTGPVDVPPLLGRLVLFLSERVEHEVLPAWSSRLALTAWYRAVEAVPTLPDPPVSEPDRAGPRRSATCDTAY